MHEDRRCCHDKVRKTVWEVSMVRTLTELSGPLKTEADKEIEAGHMNLVEKEIFTLVNNVRARQ